jgi:hypothetical protein
MRSTWNPAYSEASQRRRREVTGVVDVPDGRDIRYETASASPIHPSIAIKEVAEQSVR